MKKNGNTVQIGDFSFTENQVTDNLPGGGGGGGTPDGGGGGGGTGTSGGGGGGGGALPVLSLVAVGALGDLGGSLVLLEALSMDYK